ncbi:MAG: hypothetical protein IKA79_01925 [Lentisphaeria bacterium]|nr:hypothetical protein [Lentisphaeria bacterium]
MAVTSVKFGSKFIRTGGSVSFQERSVHPSDFTFERIIEDYAGQWAKGEEAFFLKYPFWQEFADCFVMRRAIIQINGTQKCLTASFKADELEEHLYPGFVSLKNFAIPGFDRSSIPKGSYQLKSLDFRDQGDTFTIVNISYVQYCPWELIQIDPLVPDPAGGVF